MKNSLLPSKSLLLAIIFFSLFAFLAVNVHARFAGVAATVQTEMPAKMETGEQPAQANLPLPSLTVVERVLEIAGHFLPISN